MKKLVHKSTARELVALDLDQVAGGSGTLPVPFAEGTLPFAEGTLPFAEGTLPFAEGTLPFASGSNTVFKSSGSTTVYDLEIANGATVVF
jgi:hypothetical protein